MDDVMVQAIQGCIQYVDSLYDFKALGMVIEVIVESLEVKCNVFE